MGQEVQHKEKKPEAKNVKKQSKNQWVTLLCHGIPAGKNCVNISIYKCLWFLYEHVMFSHVDFLISLISFFIFLGQQHWLTFM